MAIGQNVSITINLGRNKYEKIKGTIEQLHNNIFIIRTTNNMTRCFTYSDILTKTIVIENK